MADQVHMLRAAIICPSEDLGGELEQVLYETRLVGVARVGYYPTGPQLREAMQELRAQIVFLSTENVEDFLAVASGLEEKAPGVTVVAVTRSPEPAVFAAMLRAGAREFVAPPFDVGTVRQTLARITRLWERKNLSSKTETKVYSFLPSKPGVGASTVALNIGLALSRVPGMSVLLADFDLNAGLIGFMLRLTGEHSVVEAVGHAEELDDELWSRLVSCSGRLDVLPAGRLNPGLRIDPAFVRPLISFTRRNYDVVCLDLSGMMEKFSIELMQESGRIYMVCTPEVPSLHLASQKLDYLATLSLADRVQVLVNRAQKQSVIPLKEMERIVGAPVYSSIPNDYAKVHSGLMAGKGVEPASRLGKHFEELAGRMLDLGVPAPQKKRGLLDYFTPSPEYEVVPARE